MNEELLIQIGNRIAELRRSRNMTQEVLAEKLDISIKHISFVERGKSSLSLKHLIALCHIFHCSMDYIVLGLKNDPALSLLPKTITKILYSGDKTEIERFQKYLQIYAELYEKSGG